MHKLMAAGVRRIAADFPRCTSSAVLGHIFGLPHRNKLALKHCRLRDRVRARQMVLAAVATWQDFASSIANCSHVKHRQGQREALV